MVYKCSEGCSDCVNDDYIYSSRLEEKAYNGNFYPDTFKRGKCLACVLGYKYLSWADDDLALDLTKQYTCEKYVCGENGFIPGEGECDVKDSISKIGCTDC